MSSKSFAVMLFPSLCNHAVLGMHLCHLDEPIFKLVDFDSASDQTQPRIKRVQHAGGNSIVISIFYYCLSVLISGH